MRFMKSSAKSRNCCGCNGMVLQRPDWPSGRSAFQRPRLCPCMGSLGIWDGFCTAFCRSFFCNCGNFVAGLRGPCPGLLMRAAFRWISTQQVKLPTQLAIFPVFSVSVQPLFGYTSQTCFPPDADDHFGLDSEMNFLTALALCGFSPVRRRPQRSVFPWEDDGTSSLRSCPIPGRLCGPRACLEIPVLDSR